MSPSVVRTPMGTLFAALLAAVVGMGSGLGFIAANGGLGGSSPTQGTPPGMMDGTNPGTHDGTCVQAMNPSGLNGTHMGDHGDAMNPEQCRGMHAGLTGGTMNGH